MDPLSITAAAISMVDICLRAGKDLYVRCEDYKSAELELRETALQIQHQWVKLEQQISALRSVWDSLDEQFQAHQNLVLQVLQGKLQNAISRIDYLLGILDSMSRGRKIMARIRYAVYAKSSLVGIVGDLETWQRTFDPSWFFLARISVPAIDRQLKQRNGRQSKALSTVEQLRHAHAINSSGKGLTPPDSIFLQTGNNKLVMGEAIALSSAFMGRYINQGVIVDHFPVQEQADPNDTVKDVRSLAYTLSKVDPDVFGLLSCQGVIKIRDPKTTRITRFDFIFPIPPGFDQTTPQSLRALISDKDRKYSLAERFSLALSLARSVIFLHSARFVHKNISPENILIFQPPQLGKLGPPFLVGFERFRRAEGETYRTGDSLWEKNLYRHPQRQGLYPQEVFIMQHDIYSVGVCLLEIGLWRSFVNYSKDQNGAYTVPNPGLPIAQLLGAKDRIKAATEVKNILVDIAQTQLPILMGRIYTDVAVSCLTCLDRNNGDFGDETEFEEDDGISIGVRYIEKILFEMEKIVV